MKQQYQSEYNYYFAMLSPVYREVSTLEKYIKFRSSNNLYKMMQNERKIWGYPIC